MLSINKIQTKMNAVPRPPRRNSRRCSASFILPMEEKVEQLLISSTEEDLHSLPVLLKPSLSSKHLSVRDLDVQRFLLEQGSAMNIPQTTPWEFLLCLALGGMDRYTCRRWNRLLFPKRSATHGFMTRGRDGIQGMNRSNDVGLDGTLYVYGIRISIVLEIFSS